MKCFHIIRHLEHARTSRRTHMKSIVIGVIGADVHAVGNRIIEYTLTQAGYNVANVGVLASQEDFINAAIETSAPLILISSLYGHGELDCRGMRDKCNEAGLDDVLLYVGGNIVIGEQDFEQVEKRFKDMGFDRVYPPGVAIEDVLDQIKEDLEV
jgi:methylaspartate mutase sigma subunit